MKTYEANEELVNILLGQGFIETTSNRDKIKGKKSFRLSKSSTKEIYFDYINIRVFKSTKANDSRIKLSEPELKVILLYFKLPAQDYKEIDRYQNVNYDRVLGEISRLRKELETNAEYNHSQTRKSKIERILNAFDNIELK